MEFAFCTPACTQRCADEYPADPPSIAPHRGKGSKGFQGAFKSGNFASTRPTATTLPKGPQAANPRNTSGQNRQTDTALQAFRNILSAGNLSWAQPAFTSSQQDAQNPAVAEAVQDQSGLLNPTTQTHDSCSSDSTAQTPGRLLDALA